MRQGLLNILDIAADANATLRIPLDTQKKRHHAEYNPLCRHQFNGSRQ